MARTFIAKYDGFCPECKEEIAAGDEVTYSASDKVIHVDCSDDAQAVAAVRTAPAICAVCHLQMPCGCDATPVQRIHAVLTGSAPSPEQSAARLAKMTAGRPAPAPVPTGQQAIDAFFQQPVKIVTLEEQIENSVERDRYGRPLIAQADGSKKPYNRASSYGGQIEDNSNIARWQQQQVVRGMAMRPELAGLVPDVAKGDPWAELDKATKTALTRIADQAQEYAGSNLKSALGTQIHAATEFVDLGDSLEDKFADLEPERRALLIERGNAYYRAVQDWGLTFDSIEAFGVQDELQVAGTWDRRGFIPWWPERQQTIIDVKTSSSLDFAGVGFSVQLATYSRMCEYIIETAERVPHGDMNLDKALIIHVDRKQGGHVTLAEVDIHWGWTKAILARQILVARREGKGRVKELDVRKVQIMTASSRAELYEMKGEIDRWPSHLRALASERWTQLR